jgi:autotransporter adhesin
MDYIVEQDANKGQRTGTLWANFDQGQNITSNEQVTADIGDTTDVILSVVFNGGYVKVECNNSANDQVAHFSLSFRLLPRYRNFNPF